MVCRACPLPRPRDRRRRDLRAGRLRRRHRRPGRAADPLRVLREERRAGRRRRGGDRVDVRDPCPTGPPRCGQRPPPPTAAPPLCVASLALAAISVFVLAETTLRDVPGDPGYFADRQATYAVLGLIGMYVLARVDYSRFRELRVGIYTFLCVSISLVFVFGFAARGCPCAFDFPFFSFQPSELGKLLLVLALAGFVIDGARRGSEWQRTVRYLCLGLAPAALVFLQPDLGTALVYGAITLAVMYVGGVRWTHFAVIGAALVALTATVLVLAPTVGAPVLKGYQEERLTSFLQPSAD